MRQSYLCRSRTGPSGPAWFPSCCSPSAGTRCRTSSRRCRTRPGGTGTDRCPWRAACPPGVCTPARRRTAGRPCGRTARPPPGRTPGSSCSGPARSRWGSRGSGRCSRRTASGTLRRRPPRGTGTRLRPGGSTYLTGDGQRVKTTEAETRFTRRS